MKVIKEYPVKKLLESAEYLLGALNNVNELDNLNYNFSIVNDEECEGSECLDSLVSFFKEEYKNNPAKIWTVIKKEKK